MANPLLQPFMGWLGKLSHPRLFVVIAVLFLIDLCIPDLVPWDDIGLGLATIFLANWKKRKQDPADAIEQPPRK